MTHNNNYFQKFQEEMLSKEDEGTCVKLEYQGKLYAAYGMNLKEL